MKVSTCIHISLVLSTNSIVFKGREVGGGGVQKGNPSNYPVFVYNGNKYEKDGVESKYGGKNRKESEERSKVGWMAKFLDIPLIRRKHLVPVQRFQEAIPPTNNNNTKKYHV